MNRDYIIDLYELYKDLLTDKQKEYFEYYYYEDLSLSEIKDNIGVSRTIINRTVKLVESKLINYEGVLNLYKTKKVLNDIYKIEKDLVIKKMIEEIL